MDYSRSMTPVTHGKPKRYFNLGVRVIEIVEADTAEQAKEILWKRLDAAGFTMDDAGFDSFACDAEGWEVDDDVDGDGMRLGDTAWNEEEEDDGGG